MSIKPKMFSRMILLNAGQIFCSGAFCNTLDLPLATFDLSIFDQPLKAGFTVLLKSHVT